MALQEVRRGAEKDMEWMGVPGLREGVCKMIHVGETVYFVPGTEEGIAKKLLIEQAQKIFPGLKESEIMTKVEEYKPGYLGGAWMASIKKEDYITMLEEERNKLKIDVGKLRKIVYKQEYELSQLKKTTFADCFGNFIASKRCNECILVKSCVESKHNTQKRVITAEETSDFFGSKIERVKENDGPDQPAGAEAGAGG